MNDQDRIEAMFEAGRITREQADQLLAALAESDSAEQEIDSMDLGTTPAGAAPYLPPTGTDTGQDNGDTMPGSTDSGKAPAAAPVAPLTPRPNEAGEQAIPPGTDFKWLQIDTFAGDLEIKVVEGLSQPEVDEGDITITETGARIAPWDLREDGTPRSFIDRIFDGLRSTSLAVQLPAGWAVQFDMKAGNIEIDGAVKAIKGHLRAGDLSVTETESADVKVAAGEAEVGLRATRGSNRIQVSVGEADVRILPGSNVKIDASVNIGDISAKALTKNSRGLGAHAFGHIGSGPAGEGAELAISVVTGEVSIKAPANE